MEQKQTHKFPIELLDKPNTQRFQSLNLNSLNYDLIVLRVKYLVVVLYTKQQEASSKPDL